MADKEQIFNKTIAQDLSTESVPRDKLRECTVALAKVLLDKNPMVLSAAKIAYKHLQDMPGKQHLIKSAPKPV